MVRDHQAQLDARPDSYLLPSSILSGLCATVLLFLHQHVTPMATGLTALGLVGTIGVAITSGAFNRPTNRRIAGWSPDDVPPDYPSVRLRWNRVHAVRTACETPDPGFLHAGGADRLIRFAATRDGGRSICAGAAHLPPGDPVLLRLRRSVRPVRLPAAPQPDPVLPVHPRAIQRHWRR